MADTYSVQRFNVVPYTESSFWMVNARGIKCFHLFAYESFDDSGVMASINGEILHSMEWDSEEDMFTETPSRSKYYLSFKINNDGCSWISFGCPISDDFVLGDPRIGNIFMAGRPHFVDHASVMLTLYDWACDRMGVDPE